MPTSGRHYRHSGPMLRFLLAGVAGVALCGCTQVGGDAPSPTTAAEITGVWQGSLTENTGKGFSVKVTIDPLVTGQQSATAQYRGIGGVTGCSGSWVYEGQKGAAWEFTETITDGAGGSCAGTGTVTLTPAQDAVLQYYWKDGSGDSSNGFLSRP